MKSVDVVDVLKYVKKSATEMLTGVFGVKELLELQSAVNSATQKMSEVYSFTTKSPKNICRICGDSFDKSWSSGGIGAVCMGCHHIRQEADLVKLGMVRNIEEIDIGYITYRFEAKIDGSWFSCHTPCGDWSYVKGAEGNVFSVPVGFWELQRLYRKYYKV